MIQLASFLYGFVNYMLLRGTARLLRRPIQIIPCVFAGALSVIYTWFCFKNQFTGGVVFLVHCIFLVLCALIGFGVKKGCWSLSIVYVALNLSLGGISFGTKGLLSFAIGTIGILILSFCSNRFNDQYARVELIQDGKTLKMLALRDSGNMLLDPATGKAVLVVDAYISQQLTGLSVEQLRCPVESVNLNNGFHLIPYRTISERGRFLLGKTIDKVVIDGYETAVIIGFSPELFSSKNTFQAIIGGQR